jgi:peptidoglycan hydrolase CwlO-like protein
MPANPTPTTDSDSEIRKPFEDSGKAVVNIYKRVVTVEKEETSIDGKLDKLLKNVAELREEIKDVKQDQQDLKKRLTDAEQRLLDNSNRILTEVRLLNNSVKSGKNLHYLDVPFLDGTFPDVDLTSTTSIGPLKTKIIRNSF